MKEYEGMKEAMKEGMMEGMRPYQIYAPDKRESLTQIG
jgi:hypothetical protein